MPHIQGERIYLRDYQTDDIAGVRQWHNDLATVRYLSARYWMPQSHTDAADFVDHADLTEYDLTSMKPVQFEFAAKDARINMRLPEELLIAVKSAADKAGVPYQRFIRHALEDAVNR